MRQHLENPALHALNRGRKQPHGHKAHMRHGRICDQLLHIFLRESHERCIDNRNGTQRKHHGRKKIGRNGKHRQRKTQESVAAHFQQHTGQNYRTCSRCLNMGVRQPGMHRPHWHFDGEGRKKGEPQPILPIRRKCRFHQVGNECRAGLPIHNKHRQQHQNRAQQRVQEKLETGIDAPAAAPNPDNQEHRNQATFEK